MPCLVRRLTRPTGPRLPNSMFSASTLVARNWWEYLHHGTQHVLGTSALHSGEPVWHHTTCPTLRVFIICVGLGDKMATQSIIKGTVYVEGKAGHGAESWEGFLWEPHWTLKGREIWVLQEGSS